MNYLNLYQLKTNWTFESFINTAQLMDELGVYSMHALSFIIDDAGEMQRLRITSGGMSSNFQSPVPQSANEFVPNSFFQELLDQLRTMLIGIEKVDKKNQAFYHSLFMSLAFKNTLSNEDVPPELHPVYFEALFKFENQIMREYLNLYQLKTDWSFTGFMETAILMDDLGTSTLHYFNFLSQSHLQQLRTTSNLNHVTRNINMISNHSNNLKHYSAQDTLMKTAAETPILSVAAQQALHKESLLATKPSMNRLATRTLTTFLDSFKTQTETYAEAFERLGIDANLHACECVLSAEVANKPVTVHGTLFDYNELMRLSKVQSDGSRIIPGYPLEPFYLDQINPDRGTKNKIESLIQNCEASPKSSHG